MAKNHSTYSFDDIDCTITLAGQAYTIGGDGIGQLNIEALITKSVLDTASDGSVMTSKIAGNSGRATFESQQTSKLHKFFMKQFNILNLDDPQNWATGNLTITDPINKIKVTAENVSFERNISTGFTAEGQRVTWPLLAAFITWEYYGDEV